MRVDLETFLAGYDCSQHKFTIQQKKVHLLYSNDVVTGESSNFLTLSLCKTETKFSSKTKPE